MKLAVFESVPDAAAYRHNHGGWLFIRDSHYITSDTLWFDAQHFTPSRIMLHPLTKGQNGGLVCDDRYYQPCIVTA